MINQSTYLNSNNPHPQEHHQHSRKRPQPHTHNQPQHAAQTDLAHVRGCQDPATSSIMTRVPGGALFAQQRVLGVHGPAGVRGDLGFGAVVGSGVLALHWGCAEGGKWVEGEGEADTEAGA